MTRDLGVERLYPLGDFKNIKFSTVLKDIPDELASNEKIVSLLFFQQAIACDIAYREYYAMVDKITKENIQNIMGYLQERREQTMQQILDEVNKTKEQLDK